MRYLKIKDNVDLKELEKFGFKQNKSLKNCLIKDNSNVNYHIVKDTRKLTRYFDKGSTSHNLEIYDNTLYDLIKADLVEVVEE